MTSAGWRVSALFAVGATVLGLTAAVPAAAAGSASLADGVTLQLVAHGPAKVGGSATVDVVAVGATSVSGYELAASVEKTADLAGANTSTGPAGKAGFLDISMSDLDHTAVLAAFDTHGKTLSGRVSLGTLYVDKVPAAGVRVAIGAVRIVGADGLSKPVATSSVTTLVRPATGASSTPAAAAPAAPWQLPSGARKALKAAANPDMQMTWENVRLDGGPCSAAARPLDRNGDGCLDVGDLIRNAKVSPTDVSTVALPAKAKPVGPAATGGVASARMSPAAAAAPAAAGATYVVNSTSDAADISTSDGICKAAGNICTLRAAIQQANATSGANTITFAIPGTGVHTIQLLSHLPALNDASGGTLIDGYTQPGAAPNTDPVIDNAKIMIEVRGNGAAGDGNKSGFDALPVTSSYNTVRGLSMYNSRRELWINGTGATHNTVVGDFIGTDSTGTFISPTQELEGMGVKIELDAPYNNVGTSDSTQPPTPADRNVVSGNARQGIALWHNNTDYSIIVNNIVGLSPDGTRRVPNRKHGIDLNFGVSQVQIGGLRTGERNLVSGNDDDGVEVSHTTLTTANDVIGNYIGTDATGNAAPAYAANNDAGVYLEDAVTANTIENNVIVNSLHGGVVTINGGTNGTTTQNIIRNNLIGVGIGGAALPNQGFGIQADGSGNTYGPGNTIRYNNGPGVQIDATDAVNNKITQNTISDNTGLSIDLSPVGSVNPNDPGDADTGANDGLNYPEPLVTSPTTISGTACASCSVEVYTTGSATGNGPERAYVGTATADSSTGAFSLPISLPIGTALSAVAISPSGDTSEMAPNVTVVAAGNQAPTINAGPDITVDPGSKTALQATVSDPDGTTDSVSWDLDGNGSFESPGNPVTFTAPATGPATINVTARATDPGGLTATDSLVITVRSAPLNPAPPVARMVVPSEVVVGDSIPVTMDQPDRSGLMFAFDCGSGLGAPSATTTITCPSGTGSTATIKAQVTDPNNGLSTTYTTAVVVHTNLLSNGDFETGTTTQPAVWSWGSGRQYVTSPVHSGTHAVSTPATGTSTAVMSQPYGSAFVDARYALSGWVNVPSAGTGSVTLRVRFYDANNNNVSTFTVGTVSSATNGWVNLTGSFGQRAGVTHALVEVAFNTSGRAIAIDDVVLRHDNGIQNAEFDLDTNGDGKPDTWAQQGRFTQSNAMSHLTTFSGKSTGDGGAFTVAQRFGLVQVGGSYTINGWINVPANTSTFSLRIQLRWEDVSQKNTVALIPVLSKNGTSTSPYVTPGWQPFTATAVAPSGAAYANLEFAYSAGFNGVSYIDSVVVAES